MTIKMATIHGYGKLIVKIVNHIPNYIYLSELRFSIRLHGSRVKFIVMNNYFIYVWVLSRLTQYVSLVKTAKNNVQPIGGTDVGMDGDTTISTYIAL